MYFTLMGTRKNLIGLNPSNEELQKMKTLLHEFAQLENLGKDKLYKNRDCFF